MGRLEEQLSEIVEAIDYDAWRRVPDMVVALYKKAAPAACRLAAWSDPAAGPEDQLWWHSDTRTAWAEVVNIEKRAAWERLPDVPDVSGVALFVELLPPPPVEGWVLVKAADGYLAPIARPGLAAQRMIGGPSGMTSAIVNGLLGGGLGYGAGWIADQFLPEEHFQKGRLAKTLGLVGAGAGAIPGLWQWTAERRAQGLGAVPGLQGTGVAPPKWPVGKPEPTGYGTLPAELTGATPYPGYVLPPHKQTFEERFKSSPQTLPTPPVPMVSPTPFDTSPATLGQKITQASVHPWLYKTAEDYGTGAVFMPTIPVDDFSHAIWSDVRYPSSRYGGQAGGTPPYAAAAASGLIAGAAQAAQSDVVSPWQVATAAAIGAGKGWLTGLAAGKVLGAAGRVEARVAAETPGGWPLGWPDHRRGEHALSLSCISILATVFC